MKENMTIEELQQEIGELTSFRGTIWERLDDYYAPVSMSEEQVKRKNALEKQIKETDEQIEKLKAELQKKMKEAGIEPKKHCTIGQKTIVADKNSDGTIETIS